MDAGVSAKSVSERYYNAANNFLIAKKAYLNLTLSDRRTTETPKQPDREMLFYTLFSEDRLPSEDIINNMAEFLSTSYRDFYSIEKRYKREDQA